jgi:hypothetical protein
LVSAANPNVIPSAKTSPDLACRLGETNRAITTNAHVLRAMSNASLVTPMVVNRKAGLKATRAVAANAQLESTGAVQKVRAKAYTPPTVATPSSREKTRNLSIAAAQPAYGAR